VSLPLAFTSIVNRDWRSTSVPPARDRGEDTLLLLEHFRAMYAAKIAPFTLEESSIARWKAYIFPGNVRELPNIVIRLGAKHPDQ
jgi:DNA-binding NtrC family response regulator